MDERYYKEFAVAAIRGRLMRTGKTALLPAPLAEQPLDALTDGDCDAILALAATEGMKIYDFKRTHRDLPRVRCVLGFLHGVMPATLLDVGSGRGVFLFPLLDELPEVRVTALDILPARLEMLSDVARGGASRLAVRAGDITRLDITERYEVVTLLEVLEHIEDYRAAIRAAVRTATRYVVVSVPSHPDDNPEHIHLLTKEVLTAAFAAEGITRLRFQGVSGHLILIATVGEE
jgi:2-polyprenyl-3-methyl-5-hydroxy-6-metoxy-1,4-benzoquinol methylase